MYGTLHERKAFGSVEDFTDSRLVGGQPTGSKGIVTW